MAKRTTIQIGNPALTAPNKQVTDFIDSQIHQIIQDLQDTMRENNLIGMAAPQIAENVQIFITEPRETPARPKDQTDILRVYINPVITKTSDEEVILYEGCGSVLNGQIFGPVKRPQIITIEAYDQEGKKFQLTCDGILARVIQHEYDHLQGVEFIEKVSDYKQMMSLEYYIKRIKPDPDFQQAATITTIQYKMI